MGRADQEFDLQAEIEAAKKIMWTQLAEEGRVPVLQQPGHHSAVQNGEGGAQDIGLGQSNNPMEDARLEATDTLEVGATREFDTDLAVAINLAEGRSTGSVYPPQEAPKDMNILE
ncbi:hypothetical protein Scep_025834 [Stephania cephalantha]|uniref:Uncharacterized protein n=1 Tax=Stephania cephalantha TaxID=152367 RepID=A0AAP0HST7_9MAGN